MHKKNYNLIISLFCLLLLILLSSCQTVNFEESDNHFSIPRGQVYISKIELDTQSLQIIAKVDSDNFFNMNDFVQQFDLDFAINTTPFYYVDESKKQNVKLLGIQKINNKIISEPNEKYSALAFYFDENNEIRAKIIKSQTYESTADFPMVIGGYFTILEDGNINSFKHSKRSRSACGITPDGKTLYLMCVTSNLSQDTSGLSYQECAEIFKELGCSYAMQFDGGHSTAMFCSEFGLVSAKKARKIPAALGFYINKSE